MQYGHIAANCKSKTKVSGKAGKAKGGAKGNQKGANGKANNILPTYNPNTSNATKSQPKGGHIKGLGKGGKGEFNGGDGVTRKLRFLEPMTVTTLCSHRKIKPFGLNGGGPGECGKEWLEKNNGTILNLNGNDSCEVELNDLFVMQTPGGGGFGKK